MKKERVVCIIPARYGSTRLKAKVLCTLNGKTVLERVYGRAKLIRSFSAIYIATDHRKIADEAERFGADVIMTHGRYDSGSDRVADAARNLDASIIVNIQADAPFLPAEAVEKPLALMLKDREIRVATAATPISNKESLYDPNTVKVVIDRDNCGIYFSRSLIPYPAVYFRDSNPSSMKDVLFYKHLGVYLFRKDFLMRFSRMPVSFLERVERLEQLRIIENGYRIKVAVIKKDSPSVDTLEDIKRLTGKL